MSQDQSRLARLSRLPSHKAPPLPDMPQLEARARVAQGSTGAAADTQVPAGCYLLLVTPIQHKFDTLHGTCRIDHSTGVTLASGDLYSSLDMGTGEDLPPPDPAAGIPIFPRGNYRYYLRVTKFSETEDGFSMTFAAHYPGSIKLLDGTDTKWPLEAFFTAQMKAAYQGGGKPGSRARFTGQILDAQGTAIAEASMEHVSTFLRRASIEIDTVPASAPPLSNSKGLTWKSVFDAIGWDITIIESDRNVAEPPDKIWNKAEAHAALRAFQEKVDLNQEWRYHILAVQQIGERGAERGWMYDLGSSDDPAREDLMISSHWRIPSTPDWGLVQGKLAGETDTYFRTAVHELGHAMGLEHFGTGRSFMRGTDSIALQSLTTPETPFPDNIDWTFSFEDQQRLRHWPDPITRPGGINFSMGSEAALGTAVSPDIVLEIKPLLDQVPLGAPVRIEAHAVNRGTDRTTGPIALDLTSGPVRGWVVHESGITRAFAPLMVSEQLDNVQSMEPGDRIDASLTLLRGADGALFPLPGAYRIFFEAVWSSMGAVLSAGAETRIDITPAVDVAHAGLAQRLLTTPDLLFALALGGDHLTDAQAAIDAALRNPVLRPHYAYIEAKRLGTRFFDRAPDPEAASRLITDDTVMNRAERRKAAELTRAPAAAAPRIPAPA